MPLSPKQPRRNYLATMRRVMQGMGRIGKEVVRGGPSPRERMAKLGHKKWYRGPFVSKWTAPTQRVQSWIRGSQRIPRHMKRPVELMVERRDPKKQWSPKQRGISLEEMQKEIYPEFVKEFGEKGADALMRRLGLGKGSKPGHNKFAGGRQRSVQEVLTELRGARNAIGKYKYPTAEQIVKRAHTPFQPTHRRGFTQEEALEVEKEIGETFGPKEAAAYAKMLQAEEISSDKAKQFSGQAPRSRWKISSLTGWGKRSNGDKKS